MPKFIEITEEVTQKKMLINVSDIKSVRERFDGKAEIMLAFGIFKRGWTDISVNTEESYTAVVNLIKAAE